MNMTRNFELLRADARARGMDELAICYGWSLIRLNDEHLSAQLAQLRGGR